MCNKLHSCISSVILKFGLARVKQNKSDCRSFTIYPYTSWWLCLVTYSCSAHNGIAAIFERFKTLLLPLSPSAKMVVFWNLLGLIGNHHYSGRLLLVNKFSVSQNRSSDQYKTIACFYGLLQLRLGRETAIYRKQKLLSFENLVWWGSTHRRGQIEEKYVLSLKILKWP